MFYHSFIRLGTGKEFPKFIRLGKGRVVEENSDQTKSTNGQRSVPILEDDFSKIENDCSSGQDSILLEMGYKFYIKIRLEKGIEFQQESINQKGHLFSFPSRTWWTNKRWGWKVRENGNTKEHNLLAYSEIGLYLTSKYVVSSARLLKYSLDRMVWASRVLRLKVRSLPWTGRILLRLLSSSCCCSSAKRSSTSVRNPAGAELGVGRVPALAARLAWRSSALRDIFALVSLYPGTRRLSWGLATLRFRESRPATDYCVGFREDKTFNKGIWRKDLKVRNAQIEETCLLWRYRLVLMCSCSLLQFTVVVLGLWCNKAVDPIVGGGDLSQRWIKPQKLHQPFSLATRIWTR